GQIPLVDGKLMAEGRLGAEITAEAGKEIAQRCALNAIAAVKSVLGDLGRVKKVVKVVGFVASTPEFTAQPGVVNGASELLQAAFGDAGIHARSAVGVAVLPLNSPVEVELIVEFE
ncbi:MAG: RidA family protein, partial [Actinobacteria bacterium]|nr:RidA family protein [Actinomycetota bacterium]